jgi:hypothetical protein
VNAKQKSSASPDSPEVLLPRMRMLFEDENLIPDKVLQQFLKTPQERHIFLTVADPDQWPASMQPFRKWIENNVPPEYWAESEDEEE